MLDKNSYVETRKELSLDKARTVFRQGKSYTEQGKSDHELVLLGFAQLLEVGVPQGLLH